MSNKREKRGWIGFAGGIKFRVSSFGLEERNFFFEQAFT
jgi:hypothetical protein